MYLYQFKDLVIFKITPPKQKKIVRLHGFMNNPQSMLLLIQSLVPLHSNSWKGVWARRKPRLKLFEKKATATQRRVLSKAPQRVKHICNVWMSCHRAALQGQWLCLQEQELSEITRRSQAGKWMWEWMRNRGGDKKKLCGGGLETEE